MYTRVYFPEDNPAAREVLAACVGVSGAWLGADGCRYHKPKVLIEDDTDEMVAVVFQVGASEYVREPDGRGGYRVWHRRWRTDGHFWWCVDRDPSTVRKQQVRRAFHTPEEFAAENAIVQAEWAKARAVVRATWGAKYGPTDADDNRSVIITGDMQCGRDDNSLDLFALRELCEAWWAGQGDPLYCIGSNLYSKGPWSQLERDDDMGFVLTLPWEQWHALVKASREQTTGEYPELDPMRSEDTPEERLWSVAEHILALERALEAADAAVQP